MVTKIWELNTLSAVVVAFYTFGLPLAIWVCRKQGIGRHAGWLYLVMIAVIRIVGGALRIAADQYSTVGLVVAATAFQNIGLAAFIQAFMGVLKRINDGLAIGRVSPRIFQLTHLITLIGLLVSIVASAHSSSRLTDDQTKATAERKAAGILLLISILATSSLALYFLFRRAHVFATDSLLTYIAAATVPLFIIRVAYLLLSSFARITTYSYVATGNIYQMAFMQYFMEMLIFALFAYGGFVSQPITAEDHVEGRGVEVLPGRAMGAFGRGASPAAKTVEMDAQPEGDVAEKV